MKTDITDELKAAIEAMIRSGVTRYAIARDSKIAYHTLTRWLDEDRDIKFSTAAALAKLAGLRLKK